MIKFLKGAGQRIFRFNMTWLPTSVGSYLPVEQHAPKPHHLPVAVGSEASRHASPCALSLGTTGNPVHALLKSRVWTMTVDIHVNDEALVKSDETARAKRREADDGLYIAVLSGDRQRVHVLLSQGANPNQRGADGEPLIHTASERGETSIIKMLAWAGADKEARSGGMNAPPLLIATAKDQYKSVLTLLELGVDVNASCSNGSTALHHAAKLRDARIAMALVKIGAWVNARAVYGWTPLHVAAASNNPVVIAALVGHGAEVDSRDEDDETPLMTACYHGFSDCVQLLLACGADPRATTMVCPTYLGAWVRACEEQARYLGGNIESIRIYLPT